MTRILIVDDNPQNLYLLESILKGYQYTVVTARNGADALHVAMKNPPELVIADILMPIMDGFELCRKWKAESQLNHIPFVFYTATYTDPRDERFALSLGAERFVVKPQKPEILVQMVREVLEEAVKNPPAPPATPPGEEIEILQQYNEVLVRKLEKKVMQLEAEITERKRVEEELRSSEKFLDNIVEHIPDMIFVKDARDLRFIRFNKAGEDLLGYARGDLLGKSDHDLFPKPEADFFTGKDREVLGTNQVLDISQEKIQTKNKGERILHTKKIPILDEMGNPRYLLGISEDITDRKRAEERISLANRKLSLMTDVTYQDIQNKVTGLRGYVELSKNPQSEQDRLSFINKEMDLLETIHNLIKKTKDYQQMGVDQSRWIPLEKTIQMQWSFISQKKTVSLESDIHGLEIYADPLFDRVFYNLMRNALQHGKNLTRIAFRYRETPDGVLLICEDDGVGVPSEVKPHIFERVVGGGGKFGLFFVHEFLNIAGMKIAETGIAGKGARFEIWVPKGAYRFSGDTG